MFRCPWRLRRRRASRSRVPGDSSNNWWSRGWSKSCRERLDPPAAPHRAVALDVHLIYRQWLTIAPIDVSNAAWRSAASRTPSSARGIVLRHKISENLTLARNYLREAQKEPDLSWIFSDLAEYDRLLRLYSSKSLVSARVLEIGYGARPYRLIALLSLATDAWGVDAEMPILRGSMREYWAALRTNGLERVVKSLVRRTLFDRAERVAFRAEVERRAGTLRIDAGRFLVSARRRWI
jgi:hypothetical protein